MIVLPNTNNATHLPRHSSTHLPSHIMPTKNLLKRLTSKKLPPTPKVVDVLPRRQSNQDGTPARTTPTRRPPPPEAPPAYSAAPPVSQTPVPAPVANVTTTQADSQYSFLAQFDTVFLIDDSGSMAGRSWRETSQALEAITPICTEQDEDGVDIFFLNHRRRGSNLGAYNNVKTPTEVREIFTIAKPGGATPTGTRLNHILKPYLAQVEQHVEKVRQGHDSDLKPMNIIVITDGEPTDDLTSVIVQTAKKLDKLDAEPWQVGIQFFQVGREPGAAEALKELDDELADEYEIRDMVDTVPWTGEGELTARQLLKVVLGSVHRRLDNRRPSTEGR